MIRAVWKSFASLRLTVALLSLSMVLIFVGTLAQARMGVWEAVDTYFRSPVAWVDLQLLVPESMARVPLSVPFPGGATIGLLLLLNLLAAHTVRFKLTRRRIGVIVLHAGLIVLLAGEFITAAFADEGMMSIDEGETAYYVEDIRSVELAVIDPAGGTEPGLEREIVIPGSLLARAARAGGPVQDPALPFDVEVLEWHPNARLLRSTADGGGQADRGVGLEARIDPLPPARGVDGAQTDTPAAMIRLSTGGEPLGTWLVWANLIEAQRVEQGDAVYGLSLRYRRTYKPYSLELIDFRHDKFTGTQIARNFSSEVRLIDPERGVDRELVIWMNNPLRYRGATFYQASYKPDGSGTVLQVVRNPGAVLPYVACIMVAGGLLWHFGLGMTAFLRRRATRQAEARAAAPPAPPPSLARRLLPFAAAALGLLIAGAELTRAPAATSGGFDLDAFARLPVSAGGRVKPMDTAARHALMVAGGRQSVRLDDSEITANEFMLGLVARPEQVADLPVVRVDHPDVLALLGLAPEDAGRLPLNAIEPHWESIAEQAGRAFDVPAKSRDPFQRAIVNLFAAVDTLLAKARMREPYVIPPLGPDADWQSFHDAFIESRALVEDAGDDEIPADRIHPALAYYVAIMTAYNQNDPEAFNTSVAGYDALLRRDMPSVMRRADFEVLFNRARLFVGATAVYVLSFLLLCFSILARLRPEARDVGRIAAWGEGARVSATALLWTALLVHTVAIAARIYLQGRPPVTNLYSSAVFVGWASVLLGLILERLHPIGVAGLGAAAVGFATLVVAHNLGSDGDTMQMMQAVLDSNFWLATHVVTITLGYSATFLAGALGVAHILLGVFTRALTKERAQTLGKMVYGVVCFALLLSFVGTVLGGIWADQSWGRFWGWDPKENGAALVVLITAIILHARWGGMIRLRGMMVLAVAGNIVTAWSWFGTNMLGVGLHSYGFMDSAVFWMMAFIVSQLAVMGIGLLPTGVWRSRPT